MSGSFDPRSSQFNRSTQSQNTRPSQSSQNEQDGDAEGDVLLSMILKSKGLLVPMTKTFFQNNLKFETPLDDNMKDSLKKHMVSFLVYENQLKMQQNAFSQLEIHAQGLSQNVSNDQEIDDMLAAADLDKRYKDVMTQLEESDDFDPTEDKQFKDLLNLLTEENNNFDDNDIEMLETEFTIPIDPFSKKAVVIPVRNKTCGHLYDKESFFSMFETRPRNSALKCPYTGCANRRVTMEDIDDDPRMQILIENAQRNK
ncbi:hypothetical protein TYRP_008158 [Tyrophagus putrescentiae]|nr:hypothetical protein TYRP_008158 [Tyrophagus putrescentiae]